MPYLRVANTVTMVTVVLHFGLAIKVITSWLSWWMVYCLQLVVSSDCLSSVWQPVTQLDLSLSERGNKKLVQVELDQTELKKLITSLEAADRVRCVCVCYLFISRMLSLQYQWMWCKRPSSSLLKLWLHNVVHHPSLTTQAYVWCMQFAVCVT